jgi:hypothetical protein
MSVGSCVWCGKQYVMMRSDQKYCSHSCRQSAYKNRKNGGSNGNTKPNKNCRVAQPAEMPRAAWPSNNRLGIPTLDLDLQADYLDLPFTAYGSVSRARKMDGTWHFYTDDYRFDTIWKNREQIVNTNCQTVVEPNFSTHQQMAAAEIIWLVYRKRLMARWWQSHGIRVFVDVNVDKRWSELNLIGVPRGWRAYATRGYAERIDQLMYEYQAACNHADGNDLVFLVYGGGAKIKMLAQQHKWLYMQTMYELIRSHEYQQR